MFEIEKILFEDHAQIETQNFVTGFKMQMSS